MSTFRQEIEITLDGEVFKVTTRAVDFTNAEIQLARDGGRVDENPMALRFRLAFAAFRRCYPELDQWRAFGTFLDQLDEIHEEAELEAVPPLDPTQRADSDG